MKKYRIEIIAAIVVVVGVLLLIDLTPILNAIDRFAVTIARSLTPAILIGLGLIAAASVFIAWRIRVRFLNSAYWRVTVCPRCGGVIHRIHRSMPDKVVSKIFLPHAGRYRCEQCSWSGLRHGRRHERESAR
jgi:hypothetical protein